MPHSQYQLCLPYNCFKSKITVDCQFVSMYGICNSVITRKRLLGSVEFGSLKNLKIFNNGDGNLEFFVGPVSASFPVSNFDEKPECGSHLNNNQLISNS
ncbi:hypothetical protein MKW92_034853 [Papaver armeniacum]|nr:hypothetical protein MKW92_034853 [Papaver armeniacum]